MEINGRIGERVQRALARDGWALLEPETVGDLPGLLGALGPILPGAPGERGYRDLVPYSRDEAPAGSMSSFIGTGEQPMHTDRAHLPTPPRYIALQCIDEGEIPCPTYVWGLNCVGLLRDRPGILMESVWVFRDCVRAPFYSPIIEFGDRRVRVRFDPFCMRPASFSRVVIDRAYVELRQYTDRSTVAWKNGAVLIIDNWACLHSRAAGADQAPSRRLRRWYMGEGNGLG